MIFLTKNVLKLDRVVRSEKFILTYLAFRANDDGIAYPSLDTIASDTGYDKRHLFRLIKELEKKKLFEINRRGKRAVNQYIFNLEYYKKFEEELKKL